MSTSLIHCPWCKSTDPNKVGVHQPTGKICRDPFHCPIPDSHSINGGPFRYCQYCDWRESLAKEPPAGTAVNWLESDPPSIQTDIRNLASQYKVLLTNEQVELIAKYFESDL